MELPEIKCKGCMAAVVNLISILLEQTFYQIKQTKLWRVVFLIFSPFAPLFSILKARLFFESICPSLTQHPLSLREAAIFF